VVSSHELPSSKVRQSHWDTEHCSSVISSELYVQGRRGSPFRIRWSPVDTPRRAKRVCLYMARTSDGKRDLANDSAGTCLRAWPLRIGRKVRDFMFIAREKTWHHNFQSSRRGAGISTVRGQSIRPMRRFARTARGLADFPRIFPFSRPSVCCVR